MSNFKENINILLTGFKPFSHYDVNPSWEAVKVLGKCGLGESMEHVKFHCYELPVLYKDVKHQLPELWKSIKPDLTVHVGVSGVAMELTLEQQASNTGYEREDSAHCLPSEGCCVPGADASVCSEIIMQKICDHVNSLDEGLHAVVSHDSGRYLCDFTYYTSLSIDRRRSAFIHVPTLGNPYNLDQLVRGVREAILAMLVQLQLVPSF